MAHPHATHAERFAGTHLPLRNTAIGALGLAAALALDHQLGVEKNSRRTSDPAFIQHHHPGDQAIFVLPGCRTDGRQIMELLEPQLGKHGSTVYAVYPEKGFSVRAIREGLIQARRETNKPRASIYAISMGGLVLADLGADERFRREFGPIDSVIFDSSPSSVHDIYPKMLHLLSAAHVSRNSFAMSKAAPKIMSWLSHSEHSHEAGVDDRQVQNHLNSSAHAPLITVDGQGEYIKQHFGLQANSIADLAQRYVYVQSSNDTVVSTDGGYDGYSLAAGRRIERVIDTQRPPSSHATGPEFPSSIASLLAAGALQAAA